MTEREARIADFLARHGFGDAARTPLAGDASARRYERLRGGPRPALLMDAPPEHMDSRPYLEIAAWLAGLGLSAPQVIAAEPEQGLAVIEDLGNDLFSQVLTAGTADEALLYEAAVDVLLRLQAATPPALPRYDDAWLLAEAELLIEWFAPDLPAAVAADYRAIWRDLLPRARVGSECFVYVDYHADNLLWLPEREGLARIGLLDFQDARVGPPAYDLVSLLEDARRDVAPALAAAIIHRYLLRRPDLEPQAFMTAFAVLGAQRNAKILGLFSRLARRDGKPRYLALQPRVLRYFERDLAHPALAPLATWCRHHLGIGARS